MRLILPVMIAVLISNAISHYLAPSIYDSIIQLKDLPYLPDIHTAASYKKNAGQIMRRHIVMISLQTTYSELSGILHRNRRSKSFPLVDTLQSRILLGSVSRRHLRQALYRHVRLSRSRSSLTSAATPGGSLLPPGSLPGSVAQTPQASPQLPRREPHLDDDNGDIGLSTPAPKSYSRSSTPTSTDDASMPGTPMPFNTPRVVSVDSVIDFSRMEVDPTPLRLVEQTPLAQMHTMFSLLFINEAYVTNLGKVTGVITLQDLCDAILEDDRGQMTFTNRHGHGSSGSPGAPAHSSPGTTHAGPFQGVSHHTHTDINDDDDSHDDDDD